MNRLNTDTNYHWREYVAIMAVTLLGLIWIYQETALSLVSLWQSSETYAHGFIIFPISLYIIWRQRADLSAIAPKPSLIGLAALVALGVGWIVSQAAGVQVIAQYMFVAMLSALVVSILGLRVARTLAFPLAFTLLAVPFGEIFIRPLIDFTGDFTVLALQLTGIPVYREGSQFSIPSGNWSVVEACSGLRYLIASFTLGCLYAYLTYRSRLRQFVFIALSIIVPIIANGMRAYLIVMIGHFSNMKLAVGVDHLIYGWVFFGIVMLALFWIGSHWREDHLTEEESSATSVATESSILSTKPVKAAGYAAIALLIGWVSPFFLVHLEQQTFNSAPVTVLLPETIGEWRASSPVSKFNPHFPGATATALKEYRNGSKSIGIYIAFFRNQRDGAEVVSSQNKLADEQKDEWNVINVSMRKIDDNNLQKVKQSRLRWNNLNILAWQWYWIDNTLTASPYIAKLLQAKQRLSGEGVDGANIIIFARHDAQPDEIASTMADFLEKSSSAILQSLENSSTH